MFNFSFGGGGGFPFEEMGGGHHHHHGGRGGREEPEKEVDTTKLYETLGIEKEATRIQIKKAYRKMAMKYHPDKGGDEEKFKEISKAYEILGNDEKKELYDQYGEEGVENGGPPASGGDLFDLFSGGGRRRQGKRRGEDVVFPLKINLADLYKSTQKTLKVTRNVICRDCNGKGGKFVQKCRDCRGQGVRIIMRQLGPGMIQQMQAACDACSGKGEVIPKKGQCGSCKGKKTCKAKTNLDVFIDKGMKHGERIVFKGQADESPDETPGDVVVVIQQSTHAEFKREGHNLFYRKSLTLHEALLGFAFPITHLDGRVLIVKSRPGEVVKPGDVKCIANEGMPKHKSPYENGNLYIDFNIQFPSSNSISPEACSTLKKALPGPQRNDLPADMDMDDVEEVSMYDVNIDTERRRFKAEEAREARQRDAYDDDDDDHEGGHGQTECRTQ